MPRVRFTRPIHTVVHGDVSEGQELDVSDADAARYIRNRLAVEITPPPVKRSAARKRAADG